MSKKYFIALDEMTLDEIQVYKLLCKYSNYETNVAGYTIKQIVDSCDNRLNLTTQKVRTILKKFEKEGYIQFLTSGSKGKESTLKLTLKDMLFNQQQSNNNLTNKSEELQGFEDSNQQQSNNNVTTLQRKKEKNNNIYISVIDYLNIKANTNYRASTKNTQSYINARVKEGFIIEDFKKVIDSKSKEWLNTDFEKYLRPATLFGTKFESYLNEANKKAPAAIGAKKKYNYNNICNSNNNYSKGVEIV